MALPEDRVALLAELDRLESEYLDVAGGLDEAAWNRQAVPGKKWSVGQVFDHLAKINAAYLPALAAGARRAARGPRPLAPNLLGRWFVAEMEPPPRRRLPAPAVAVPDSRLDPRATWEAFRAAQAAAVALVTDSAELDLNRVRFRNPFLAGLPVFNVATGLLVIAAHERRHLVQAQAARRAALS